ncbi:MAG: hypothetical protein K9M98_00720 [Cephaloticoccus sp.]|nr:hypothetical protein [Cephaloticoccus sp.]MCF7759001.1 hypothetical protein [Cephaloticoccus sp.]
MRLFASLVLLSCVAPVLPSAGLAQEGGEVAFVRIWPQWRTTESFVRISEYFGGEENTGRQTMLRTQPGDRAGFYFLTRTRNPGAARPEAKFILEIIKPDSPRTKTYTFPAVLPAGDHVFNLGLTGTDWTGKDVQPVAWHLQLVDADGHQLASSQSFLWRMPDNGAH